MKRFDSPMPDRWRINGDESVPPETTICLRALKMRPLSSWGSSGFVGLQLQVLASYTQ
jgi:hypothetical protein